MADEKALKKDLLILLSSSDLKSSLDKIESLYMTMYSMFCPMGS